MYEVLFWVLLGIRKEFNNIVVEDFCYKFRICVSLYILLSSGLKYYIVKIVSLEETIMIFFFLLLRIEILNMEVFCG